MQEFDLREAANGYSGTMVYEDDDLYVSLCRENTYRSNKQVAIVELKRLNIRVLGNEDLYALCESFLKDKDSKRFGNSVVGMLRITYNFMVEFQKLNYESGVRDGKNEVRVAFKELM